MFVLKLGVRKPNGCSFARALALNSYKTDFEGSTEYVLLLAHFMSQNLNTIYVVFRLDNLCFEDDKQYSSDNFL